MESFCRADRPGSGRGMPCASSTILLLYSTGNCVTIWLSASGMNMYQFIFENSPANMWWETSIWKEHWVILIQSSSDGCLWMKALLIFPFLVKFNIQTERGNDCAQNDGGEKWLPVSQLVTATAWLRWEANPSHHRWANREKYWQILCTSCVLKLESLATMANALDPYSHGSSLTYRVVPHY